jgi:ABC-type multidrug transport system permease subunit
MATGRGLPADAPTALPMDENEDGTWKAPKSQFVPTSGIPNLPEIFGTVSLVTPQGWALRAWQITLNGGGMADALSSVTVLIAMGLVFLTVGVLVFRRRFA